MPRLTRSTKEFCKDGRQLLADGYVKNKLFFCSSKVRFRADRRKPFDLTSTRPSGRSNPYPPLDGRQTARNGKSRSKHHRCGSFYSHGASMASDNAKLNRIFADDKDDWNRCGCRLSCDGRGITPATITAICPRTNSTATAGSRSFWPSTKRYVIATFSPSTWPVSFRPG